MTINKANVYIATWKVDITRYVTVHKGVGVQGGCTPSHVEHEAKDNIYIIKHRIRQFYCR